MPARPYQIHVILPSHTICNPIYRQAIPCHARKDIPYTMPGPPSNILYTMPCPPSHCINHAMPARPYHIPCHAFQAKPYTMPGMPSHTLYHAIPDRPHQMPCPPTITIYHAMSTRLYHNTIPYPMPCP